MNKTCLWGLWGVVLLLAVSPAMAATFNITRVTPFTENLVCQALNDIYIVTGLVNTTTSNQTQNQTQPQPQQLGLEYNVEFSSSAKPNGTQNNVLFIHDFDGATIQQRDWSFTPGETKEVSFLLPFQCPADLTPQINFQTCSAFFDQFISKEEPLLFTLAGATRQCNDLLINTSAQFIACTNEKVEIDKARAQLGSEKTDAEQAYEQCLRDLREPDGACQERIDFEANRTFTCFKEKSEKVDVIYMWGFWAMLSFAGALLLWGKIW